MDKRILLSFSFVLLVFSFCFTQNIQVETILDLDASGGVTYGSDGNVYISDFGPALGTASFNTKVYKVDYGTWEVSEYATGFSGASGSRFDSQGNFYQSNPSGARVSKRSPDGIVDYNWVTGMSAPIGITNDEAENLYVCNCGNNTIRKINPDGTATVFASGSLFNCPNGITIDPEGNLYVCNFSDGRIIKITPDGDPSLFHTFPIYGGVGNGHLTFSNGFLFVATIGVGQIYKLSLTGEEELIAGISQGFSNNDGPGLQATFSKPNGMAASYTGDTLWVNCSVPTWISNNLALHPGKVRMITGVCSLEDVDCPLLTKTKEIINPSEHEFAVLFPPTPNPVTLEKALISYTLYGLPQNIHLKLMDASNTLIDSLFKGRKTAGTYSVEWNSANWSSGIYYVVLESEGYVLSQKMVVLR